VIALETEASAAVLHSAIAVVSARGREVSVAAPPDRAAFVVVPAWVAGVAGGLAEGAVVEAEEEEEVVAAAAEEGGNESCIAERP